MPTEPPSGKPNLGTVARLSGNIGESALRASPPEIHLFPGLGLVAIPVAGLAGAAAFLAIEIPTLGLGTGPAAVVGVSAATVTYAALPRDNGKAVLTAPQGSVMTFTETQRDVLTRQEFGSRTITILTGNSRTIEANDGKDHLLRDFHLRTASIADAAVAWWNDNGWWVAIAGIVGMTVAGALWIDRVRKQARVVRAAAGEKVTVIPSTPSTPRSAVPAAVASVVGSGAKATADVVQAIERTEAEKVKAAKKGAA